MRILVIGGTRFIGPAAIRRLHGMGHDVTVFHRGETESTDLPAIPHLHGKRRHLADFADDVRRFAPDIVLDTAAYTERDAQIAMGTLSGIARRIVTLSSMDVYRAYGRVKGSEHGPLDPVPLTEDASLRTLLYPDAADVPDARDHDNILVRCRISDRAIDEATRAGAIDGDLAKLPELDVSPAATVKMAAAIRRRRDTDSATASPPRSASSSWITPRHDIGDTSVLFAVARIYLWARGQRDPIARMTHRPPMC